MNTFLQAHMADLHLHDLHDAAERARKAHVEADADSGDTYDCVWVRLADASRCGGSARARGARVERQHRRTRPSLPR